MSDKAISPLAKRLAEENSIDWRQLEGTSPDGSINERDILTRLGQIMEGEIDLPPAFDTKQLETTRPRDQHQGSPMNLRKFLIPAVVVVLLGGLLAALLTPQAPANTSTATVTGKIAPNFTLSTLEGQQLSLQQFKGKPVVLNFFASWCGPCKDEAPMISSAAQEFKDVIFLGIAYNDKLEKAKEFRDTYNLSFPVVMDDDSDAGRSSVKYALFSVPETYFIDRAGVIQRHNAGPIKRSDLEAGLKTIGAL